MKIHLLALVQILTFSFPLLLNGQQLITGTIQHDNLERTFHLYVPAMYDGSTATPLVMNFHGFGSSGTQQMWYGDFRGIADTTGILVVHPEGTLFEGNAHWNVGGFTSGSTIDDIGFTESLIDHLAANYNIDLKRVYSTGMSNGGYMSFLLACQLGEKIAAIASVTGSMTPGTFQNCDPAHPTPVMQIHGTTDGTVPYEGAIWSESISDVLDYWINFNACNNVPEITQLPDINTADECTAEKIIYSGGDKGTTVEHYKIYGGQHTWPGSIFGAAGTNKDFNASRVIWDFFSRYSLDDLTGTSPWSLKKNEGKNIYVYPNPAQNTLIVQNEFIKEAGYEILTPEGKVWQSGELKPKNQSIDISDLPQGIYVLKVGNSIVKFIK